MIAHIFHSITFLYLKFQSFAAPPKNQEFSGRNSREGSDDEVVAEEALASGDEGEEVGQQTQHDAQGFDVSSDEEDREEVEDSHGKMGGSSLKRAKHEIHGDEENDEDVALSDGEEGEERMYSEKVSTFRLLAISYL